METINSVTPHSTYTLQTMNPISFDHLVSTPNFIDTHHINDHAHNQSVIEDAKYRHF
jgi:hypothetical protein